MKVNQINTKVLASIAMLMAIFAFLPAQAAPAAAAQLVKIEAVVVARDGKNLTIHSETGDSVITLTDATSIKQISGFLGLSRKSMGTEVLIPGLRVSIDGELSGGNTTAKNVNFYADDLKTAQQMQAALTIPQQRIKEQEQIIKEQEQLIAANKQGIAANKEGLVQAKAEDEAIAKRIGDLADYDMKGELTILFDINSAKLSEKGKMDLKALADTAKTMKGYLIQVAGYTSSTGNDASNQSLSDRRAESAIIYLQQECDIAISRVLSPVAMGKSKPVAGNETEKGRAENRRVTVKILVNRGIAQ